MSGALPDACARCGAFTVNGRDTCPFCGASVHDAVPGGTAANAMAPLTGAPLGQPRPAAASPRRSRSIWSRPVRRLVGLGIGLLIGWSGIVHSGDGGTDPAGGIADAEEAEQSAVAEALTGVCAATPTPIADAKPYEPGPGHHRVELVVLPGGDESIGATTGRIPLGLDEGWESPGADDDVQLAEVELVGCFQVVAPKIARTCEYEGRTSGRRVDLPVWVAPGRLTVREATTGKVVLQQDIGADEPECPMYLPASEQRVIDYPEDAIQLVLRRVNPAA